MRTHPPRPWFLLVSVVLVVAASLWLVHGREIDGHSAFVAWDVLITWSVCLVLAIFDYCRKWVAHRHRRAASPAGTEPDL